MRQSNSHQQDSDEQPRRRLSPIGAITFGYVLLACLWILAIDEWWEHRPDANDVAQVYDLLVWGLVALSALVLYVALRLFSADHNGEGARPAHGEHDDAGLVLRLDASGRLRDWNSVASRKLGLDATWRGRDFLELAATADTDALRTKLSTAAAGCEFTFETRLRNAEGITTAYLAGARRAETDGQAILILTMLELGEVARSRQQLAQKERQFRQMVETVPQLIAIVDDSKIAYLNPAGALLLGAPDAETLIGTDWNRVHQEPTAESPAMLRRLDGTAFDAEIVEMPIFYDEKVATLIEARDVTESSRALSALRESERRLTTIMNTVRDAVVVVDDKGFVHSLNEVAEHMFGQPQHEVIGSAIQAFFDDSSREPYESFLKEQSAEAAIPHFHPSLQIKARRTDGHIFPARLWMSEIRDASKRLFVCVIRDKSQERELALRAAVAETVMQATSEGVMVTNLRGIIEWVNTAFCRISGYQREEVLGEDAALLKSGVHGPEGSGLPWAEIQAKGEWAGEMWNRRKDGEVYPEWLTLKAVRDAQGEPMRLVGIFSDISRHKRAEETIKHLTYYDAVTRLPNRYLFHDRLSQAVERAHRIGKLVSLALISVDRFRTINETLGHTVGDMLLRAIADRLGKAIRSQDTVARLRGDTFCCIIGDLERSRDATPFVNRILDAFTPSFTVDGHELFVTVRVGISVYPLDGTDLDDLINKSEKAMNRSKAAGENTYHFYTPEMHADSVERLRLETDLRKAVRRGQLVLHYQPKISVTDGTLTGAEALVRWQHPEMGLIPPGRFIPIAEETGLIEAIGNWVVHDACRQIAHWRASDIPVVPISVNFSANQFRRTGLVEYVVSALQEFGIDPGLLEAELTESAVMQNADVAISRLEGLHDAGLTLAIDDFGTGYSSLSYLRRFPLDRLKIDRSFVMDLGSSSAGEEIVSAIIAMAHSLNLRVVAEGVETVDQFEQLRRLHCDEIQGYLFSRPIPADEFAAVLKRGSFEMPPAPASQNKSRTRRRKPSAETAAEPVAADSGEVRERRRAAK